MRQRNADSGGRAEHEAGREMVRANTGLAAVAAEWRKFGTRMVGVTGIEPVTPAMSMQCSPAELHAHPKPRIHHIMAERVNSENDRMAGYLPLAAGGGKNGRVCRDSG